MILTLMLILKIHENGVFYLCFILRTFFGPFIHSFKKNSTKSPANFFWGTRYHSLMISIGLYEGKFFRKEQYIRYPIQPGCPFLPVVISNHLAKAILEARAIIRVRVFVGG